MDPSSSQPGGYAPRYDAPENRQPGAGSALPISHPYPPSYRPQTSDPPSQSYAYDQNRRPHQAVHHPSYSESQNPYDPRRTAPGPRIDVTAPVEGEERSKEEGTPPGPAARGPKIGKGQYADANVWTKEDEEAEAAFAKEGMFDWKQLKRWRWWLRAQWWYWYLLIIVIGVLVGLMTLYNDQIVAWLTPWAQKARELPAGFTIPIAALVILSFPPLFGAELVLLIAGAVWGLWWGFMIASIGTVVGELANYVAFKYCLRGRAEKMEETSPSYASLAYIVRNGGMWLACVIRFSAVPGHFSTAVFATCGMSIFVFTISTILTLPKQLIIVYLGSTVTNGGEKSNKERAIKWSILAVGLVLTVWSAWYIWRKMNRARIVIWRKERLVRRAAAAEGLAVDGAQVNRRISYKAMLAESSDDIEALSPMLARDPTAHGPMRQAYNTPYELQQVHTLPQAPSPSSIDFSAPPSYKSPTATPRPTPRSELKSSRQDSGTLPSPPDEELQANFSSGHEQGSAYDLDRPPVREHQQIDFGYNPNASIEQFPMPQPHSTGSSPERPLVGRRVSHYDPSAEAGYDGRAVGYAEPMRQAQGAQEGVGYGAGPGRGYQVTDQPVQR